MASRIYRRSKTGPYWADYTDPYGKRHQHSLRTTDKLVARERLRQHELAATPKARGRKQRLSEAIGLMISLLHDKAEGTRKMYEQKGRRLFKTLGDPYIHEIDMDTLTGYIAKRLNPEDEEHGQASAHTVSKELITVRRALKVAKGRGVLPVMPEFPSFSPKYVPREIWLTEQQFTLVCAQLPPKRVMWASLAALGGLRSSEVEGLPWTKIFARLARIPGTKTADAIRTVPIAPALRQLLDAVPKEQQVGKVVEHWGNVRRDLQVAVRRANRHLKEWSQAMRVAFEPIPYVSPNDLRRTFASWLIQNGVDKGTVAKLLGHASSRMVERVYGRLSAKNLEEAVSVLPMLWGPGSTVTTVSAQLPQTDLTRQLPHKSESEDSDS